MYLVHLLLLSQTLEQVARSEAEDLVLEPRSVWDAVPSYQPLSLKAYDVEKHTYCFSLFGCVFLVFYPNAFFK